MAVDPGVIGPSTLALTSALGLFQAFLPSFGEIAKTNPEDNPQLAQDVRMGEVGAGALTIGIGAMMSALTGSSVPSYVAITSTAIMVALFETALRRKTSAPAGAFPTDVTGVVNAQ